MDEERGKARLDNTPRRRIAYPEDMGNPAAFLVSEQASHMPGKIIRLDGGIVWQGA